MNKLTNVDRINMTSFHGDTIRATVQELKDVLGEPDYSDNSGQDKTNYEWFLETADGKAVTLYDWKEYRSLGDYDEIVWHIGGHSGSDTYSAQQELELSLNMQRA